MRGIDITSLRVDHTTMGGMLRWHAAYRPADVAIDCADEVRSWEQLNAAVNRCANALMTLGLTTGSNVAVLMSNRLEYLEIYLACAKTGISVTPVNYHFASAEVAHVINDSHAAAVLHDGAKAPLIRQLSAGGIDIAPDRILEVDGPASEYGRLTAAMADHEPDVPPVTGEEVFFIGYTSGTTGFPKGCVQTHRSFVEHFRLAATRYPHRPGEVMLIPGPLFHEAPTLFALAHLFAGGHVVLMPAFEPTDVLDRIERHRCTVIGFAVPTMLDRLHEVDRATDTSSVRVITTAGAPLHAETIEHTLELFTNAELHEFYGATEIGLATDIGHRAQGRPGSCGRPFPGISVAVLGDDGEPTGPGERGLVYVTPLLMDGYLGNEEATNAGTLVRQGVEWFTLGDIGYLDDDGFLYLVDRQSHMIISGGENIYPAEVEAALITHPDVDDIAIIGAPDERWGETVVAVVVSRNPQLSLDDLRDFLEGRLARYKWPRLIQHTQELPRTPSGKIQKHRIRLS